MGPMTIQSRTLWGMSFAICLMGTANAWGTLSPSRGYSCSSKNQAFSLGIALSSPSTTGAPEIFVHYYSEPPTDAPLKSDQSTLISIENVHVEADGTLQVRLESSSLGLYAVTISPGGESEAHFSDREIQLNCRMAGMASTNTD